MTDFHLGCGIGGLASLPASSVDLTVTSPPYGTLRSFGGHPYGWTEFTSMADQMWRVTKPGGVVCWVVGDTMEGGSYTGAPYRQLLYFTGLGFRHYETLYLYGPGGRNKKRHYANNVQYIWVLSNGRPTTVTLRKKPNVTAGRTSGIGYRRADGTRKNEPRVLVGPNSVAEVWWYYHHSGHTEPPYNQVPHGATMHNHLTRDLVMSYSSDDAIVCDPMAGLATTLKWAVLLQRRYVGWEIHRPYWEWGQRRLSDARMAVLRSR